MPLSIETNQGEINNLGLILIWAGFVSRNYTVTVKTQPNELASYVSQITHEETKKQNRVWLSIYFYLVEQYENIVLP